MSKPITLTPDKWEILKSHLLTQHPQSHIIISWKCKEKLGFTVRSHEYWEPREVAPGIKKNKFVNVICLDFYNDSVQTMFRLRYSEFIQNDLNKDL